MTLYRALQLAVRPLLRALGPVHAEGLDYVPARGPFFLIANHQSLLDPIYIQAVCPRVLHTMTKSTQFASPVLRWLLTRNYAFPVRRYEVDPQAVRVALRRIAAGQGVCIYIEGERSWDGRLQPPRLGTVRLLLKAGAPVVPCAIQGSYDVLPRWDTRLRRAPVRIRFGPPLRFPRLDRRADRESALPEAARRVHQALAALLDAAPPDTPPADPQAARPMTVPSAARYP